MHLPFSVVKSRTRAPFEQVFRSTTIPQFMWWSSYNLVGVHQYCTHVLRCTSISGGTVSERSAKSLSTEQKGLYWASIRVRSFQVEAYNTEATHLTFSMQADKSTRVTRGVCVCWSMRVCAVLMPRVWQLRLEGTCVTRSPEV